MRPISLALLLAVFALSLPAGKASAAEDKGKSTQSEQAQSQSDNYDAYLRREAKIGPTRIALRDQANLDLPANYAFLPEKPAAALMKRLGNDTDANFVGIILPATESSWFVTVDYLPSGHVNDADARSWNADDLLESIRKNTAEGNKKREEAGIPGLDIVGWVEQPHYDEATRRLVWSVEARNHGAADSSDSIINYKTLMLGREGYVSMDMVTQRSDINGQKPIANLLLSKLSFASGKRYGDFNASTDKVAEYGLAALVAGVAAKKLGLLALAAVFLAKFAKIGIVAVLGFLAAFRRLFGRFRRTPAAFPDAGIPASRADPPQAARGTENAAPDASP